MIKMDTIPIFSTPILVADFEKHNEYKDKFVDVPKFERKPKTWIASVNTSFPQVRPGDDVMPDGIKEDILENVKSIMSFNGLPQEIDYNNFWYNIYYDNQGQERHDHLSPKNNNPFWSGIYFAKKLAGHIGVRKIVPFKKFGTALIPHRDFQIEVASSRSESYEDDSRSPKKVVFTSHTI